MKAYYCNIKDFEPSKERIVKARDLILRCIQDNAVFKLGEHPTHHFLLSGINNNIMEDSHLLFEIESYKREIMYYIKNFRAYNGRAFPASSNNISEV